MCPRLCGCAQIQTRVACIRATCAIPQCNRGPDRVGEREEREEERFPQTRVMIHRQRQNHNTASNNIILIKLQLKKVCSVSGTRDLNKFSQPLSEGGITMPTLQMGKSRLGGYTGCSV